MLEEITRFVHWIRRRNPAAHTFQDYRSDLRHFVAHIGDKPLAAITFRDIDAFVQAQVDADYSPATIKRHLTTIASLYSFLADEIEPEANGGPALVCPVRFPCHSLRQRQALPRPVPAADLFAFFRKIAGTWPWEICVRPDIQLLAAADRDVFIIKRHVQVFYIELERFTDSQTCLKQQLEQQPVALPISRNDGNDPFNVLTPQGANLSWSSFFGRKLGHWGVITNSDDLFRQRTQS